MKAIVAVVASVFALSAAPAFAIERVGLLRESAGVPPASASEPCAIGARPYVEGTGALDGSCANYRWFNVCAGYIWIYNLGYDDAVGTSFRAIDGLECIAPGNTVKRAITYFRDILPGYGSIDVFLDKDSDADACPDGVIASDLGIDPALRWNCSDFEVQIPEGVTALVVRTVNRSSYPDFATDAARGAPCDSPGSPHSFYYGYNSSSACIPWRTFSPNGRDDNFLYWLIVDAAATNTESKSWGNVKALYR